MRGIAMKREGATGGDRWIPWLFVGGMALVVAVNGVMVWLALSTWSGLAVSAPYQRGLDYNRVLAAVAEQDELGWAVTATFTPARPGERDGAVVVTVVDRGGKPVPGVTLSARLVRPLADADEIPLDLRPAGGARHAATVTLPRSGQWELRLAAQQAQLAHQSTHRLRVP